MSSDAAPDNNSLLTHVSTLESERKKLMEKVQLQEQQLERFNAKKREDMKKQFDTVVSDYFKDIDFSDDKVREELMGGVETMVQKAKDDHPVWKLIACASSTHKRNATELNRVTTEYNALKAQVEGGSFRTSDARVAGNKRTEPEPATTQRGGNYWDDFEADVRGGGGLANFVPEPDRFKEMRKEWTPMQPL